MNQRKRHPAEVTAYRLLLMLDKYGDKLDGQERDAIGVTIAALDEIRDGAR